MNIDKLFPSKWIKAEDIGEKQFTLTMTKVTEEEMGKDKDINPVLWFKEAQKGLILNKLNATTIAGLYGKETSDWNGKRISLYVTGVRAFGEDRLVIRVANKVPVEKQATPPAEPVKQVVTPPPVVNEKHRLYLKQVVELSCRHDSLFEESTDLTELKNAMMEWDSVFEEDGDKLMPVIPSPGKPESMYSYLLSRIDEATEMGGMGEPILSYLLGRIVTGMTPPALACRPLLDDLRGDGDYVDALMAAAFIINEQVPAP